MTANIYSSLQVIKQKTSVALLKLLSPTAKNLAGYMSLTYSITGLLVILGIAGKHVTAADVAIVQGAVLATFYVLSGDARHLILTDQIHANNVVFFRLIWIVPLAILSYYMSTIAGHVGSVIAYGLILRRCAEWLAEPHVTEIERQNGKWPGWYLQPIVFLMFIGQIIFTDTLWLIWIWAISPIFFSLKFISQAKPHNFLNLGWENITSTAVIGFTGYIQRVLIVSLVGKEFSGILFPGFALGSFVGSMVANVAGPTLSRKGMLHSIYFTVSLIALSLIGVWVFFISETILYKTIGLSIIGGAAMMAAQQSRLSLLKDNHTLELDILLQLILVFSIPALYYVGDKQFLSAFYLIGSILAWIFYKGSKLAMKFDHVWRTRLFVLIVLGLIFPIFFQMNGQVYNNEIMAMVDSGGDLKTLPLPLSLLACYLGVLLFRVEYYQSKPVILTIVAMFLLMVTSTMLVNQGVSKLMLLVQYMVPTVALLLGSALADFNRKLIAKTILYFLVFFVPVQLIMTWIQGQLALTHYMYLFSVYSHYQYVPLVMVGLYVWTWVELRDTHLKWMYFLAPWMAMYVAAGNSILAFFGLIAFSCAFAIPARKRKLDLLIPVIMLVSISGYFYLNSQVATEIGMRNESKGFTSRGIFVAKLFDKNGHWLYTQNTQNTQNTQIPINLTDRGVFASIYLKDIIEHPISILIGHSSPPSRSVASSAHNYYLDMMYNFGVVACLPLLLLLLYTVIRSSQQRANDHSLLWLLVIVLYFVVVDSNLKVTLRQPYPAIVAFFLWGILLGKLKFLQPKNNLDPIHINIDS
jgi:hypothetical protein